MGNSVHMAKGQKQSFFTKRNTRKNDESFEKQGNHQTWNVSLSEMHIFQGKIDKIKEKSKNNPAMSYIWTE